MTPKKVVDTEGKEKDLFYRYGITDEKVSVEEVDESGNWEKNSYYNLQFIDGTMKACQRFLDIHGWITMDRVLEKLGIRFPEGDPRNIIAHQIIIRQ